MPKLITYKSHPINYSLTIENNNFAQNAGAVKERLLQANKFGSIIVNLLSIDLIHICATAQHIYQSIHSWEQILDSSCKTEIVHYT